MSLGDRIKCILKERNLKQVEFASNLGISANYVNLLVNDKKDTLSEPLARLIEETYGYSSAWLISGEGEKLITPSVSAIKNELLRKVKKMPDDEVTALLAFANSMDSIKKAFGIEDKEDL